MRAEADEPVLVVEVATRRYALPLQHVREILRPLKLEALADGPAYVLGVSVVRGQPTPVVDLARLLGADDAGVRTRWVRLRVEKRDVVLAVDAALGVRSIGEALLAQLPPLLREAERTHIDQLGMLDDRLLRVLGGGLQLPDEVWASLRATT